MFTRTDVIFADSLPLLHGTLKDNARQTVAATECKSIQVGNAIRYSDARQTVAAAECISTDVGNTIRDGNALQTGAAIEYNLIDVGEVTFHVAIVEYTDFFSGS